MPIKEHMPERRLEGRLLCSEVLEVAWKDKSGWARTSTALLEDISGAGACLQIEVPIPTRTRVQLHVHKATLSGEVRYCAFREIGYFVGLQFPDEQRWSRRLFRPRHLVDVQRLAARQADAKAAG